MVQGTNSADLNGGIREGEPPIFPNSRRAAQGDPPSRLEGFAVAFLLVISFMCITGFIYVETFPMGRLFLLYATHGPWGDRSGWGPVAFSLGLAGIVLAFASNVPTRRAPQLAMKLFAWLFLLMAAMLLLARRLSCCPSSRRYRLWGYRWLGSEFETCRSAVLPLNRLRGRRRFGKVRKRWSGSIQRNCLTFVGQSRYARS